MPVWNIKLLYYAKIDVSKGIDVTKQVYQKSVMFVTIGISQIIVLSFKQMSSTDVMVINDVCES